MRLPMSPVSRLNPKLQFPKKGGFTMLKWLKRKTPLTRVDKQIRKLTRVRWFCRSVIIGSAAFSIWANMLHAKPGVVPLVIAAAPPVFVLGTWEMISRVPIREHAKWLYRLTRPSAIVAIMCGSAWLSYWHQKAAVWRYTEDPQASAILPGLVDALMIIGSVTVLEINWMIDNLQNAEEGRAVRLVPPRSRPRHQTTLTKKEMVAQVLSKNPTWEVGQIAHAVGASYGYTHALVQELRRMDGAELVDA